MPLFFSFIFYSIYYFHDKQLIAENSIDPVLVPVKEVLLEVQQEQGFQQLSKKEKLEKTYQVLEQLPQEYKTLKRQYQIALSTLPNITFYGRVIDQYNQPVKNATVWYEGANTYLSAGGGRGLVTTDDNGYFEIDTEGASLTIGTVTHSEIGQISYELPKLTNSWLSARAGSINFLSAKDKQGIYPTWRDHSEKNKAYIIHAWRLGDYEGAKSGYVSAGLLATGKIYTLKLNEIKRRNRLIEGQKEGHFHISCTRPHIDSYKDRFDWSASIIPVNGGIQETNDLYMNIAPATGYQSSLNIVMRKGSNDYKHKLLNKRYYFTANGKDYGSLFVHFDPFASIEEDACSISIRYKINPTGSRNLELKRDNTSQPQLPSSQSLASN